MSAETSIANGQNFSAANAKPLNRALMARIKARKILSLNF
jgi:hypothetical protein